MQPKCSLLALEEAQFLSLGIREMLKTESERNRHSGFGGPSKASYGLLITENTQMFVKKTSLKYNHPIIFFHLGFYQNLPDQLYIKICRILVSRQVQMT